jgi:hypothetical protein
MTTLVDYTDQVSEYRYVIEVSTHNRLRYYRGIGKAYPTTTIGRVYVFKGEKRILFYEQSVVKHADDPNNPKLAARLVAKKLIDSTCYSRRLRTDLWKEINKNVEKL